MAGVGLNLAFADIAAKLLRQPVLAAEGFPFAGNIFPQRVGGIRPRASRVSSRGHGCLLQREGIASPWWATLPRPVNTRLRAPKPYGIVRPLCKRRRSSGVERALGKGEAVSSILTGGTTFPLLSRGLHYTPKMGLCRTLHEHAPFFGVKSG